MVLSFWVSVARRRNWSRTDLIPLTEPHILPIGSSLVSQALYTQLVMVASVASLVPLPVLLVRPMR